MLKSEKPGRTVNNEKNNIPVIEISVRENIGISQLEDTLKYMFYAGKLTFNDEIYISNIRQDRKSVV